MSKAYALYIDEYLDVKDFNSLMKYVSPDQQERISHFRRYEDAQRSLLGYILARYVIRKKIGCIYETLEFGATEYGKPILLNPTGLHFNVSHSGFWVVCIVCSKPVGIDVELIRPININIAKRFFSKDEFMEVQRQPNRIMRLLRFYELWTLKESYIKFQGYGLRKALNSFSIVIKNKKIMLEDPQGEADKSFKLSMLDGNYLVATCSSGGDLKRISCLKVSRLMKMFISKGLV